MDSQTQNVALLAESVPRTIQHNRRRKMRMRARKETVKHFLLICSKYEKERDKLRREVGAQGMRDEKLLGDVKKVKHTLQFIKDTGRFDF